MAPRPRTTPRKSPRQARSKSTVDAILEATARVLVADGYDRASTNKIALAAGVSVGSLYQYFPNKEALVAALIERHGQDMIAELESMVAGLADAPLPHAARALVAAMVRAHGRDPRLHKVLIEQVPRVGRLNRLDDLERHLSATLRAALERRRDEVRPRDLELAVFVLVRAVEALTHAAVLERPEYLADARLVDEVTTLVLRYLQLDPPAGPR